MTTFDLVEVRTFTAGLESRMNGCQNGEGLQCATLDAALRHHASLCCEFTNRVKSWGREVFAGRVAFDPEVEAVWHSARGRSCMPGPWRCMALARMP